MKKFKILLGILAAMIVFISCEQKEPVVNPDETGKTTVKLVSPESSNLKAGNYDRGSAPLYIDSIEIDVEDIGGTVISSEWYTFATTGGDPIEIEHDFGDHNFLCSANSIGTNYVEFTTDLFAGFDPMGALTLNEYFATLVDAESIDTKAIFSGESGLVTSTLAGPNTASIAMTTNNIRADFGLYISDEVYGEANVVYGGTTQTLTNTTSATFTNHGITTSAIFNIDVNVWTDNLKTDLLYTDSFTWSAATAGKQYNVVLKYEGDTELPPTLTMTTVGVTWVFDRDDQIVILD